jgi:hypothetical protein
MNLYIMARPSIEDQLCDAGAEIRSNGVIVKNRDGCARVGLECVNQGLGNSVSAQIDYPVTNRILCARAGGPQ